MGKSRRRSYIVGMGVISCIGSDLHTFWHSVRNAVSGITPLPEALARTTGCSVAGQVTFGINDYFGPGADRKVSRFQAICAAAVEGALKDCGLLGSDLSNTGLIIGTSTSGIAHLPEYYDFSVSPVVVRDRLGVLKWTSHSAAAFCAERFKIEGPSLTIGTACAASTDALRIAHQMIQTGECDRVVVAGAESWLTEMTLKSMAKLGALTKRPADSACAASRPFSLDRDGLVPAEGAAALVLESENQCVALGRNPYAAILGAGASCDASHPVSPRPDGLVAMRAVMRALQSASCAPDDVTDISAHATSTKLNDRAETAVYRHIFGDRLVDIPVAAMKSVTGHALGAGGALESVGVALSVANEIIPATANQDSPDPELGIKTLTQPRDVSGQRVVLKTSFGFGGHNSAIIFGCP